MTDEERVDADGFIRKINRNTDFFATRHGSAVIVYEVTVPARKAGEPQSNPIECIDPENYGYQFSRIEKDGDVIFFPLS